MAARARRAQDEPVAQLNRRTTCGAAVSRYQAWCRGDLRLGAVPEYPFLKAIPGISDFAVRSSPNANTTRYGVLPDVIMIHCTDGSGDADSVGRSFANPGRDASSTFSIGRPGEVRQHVPLPWTAWDAGGGHFPSSAELERALVEWNALVDGGASPEYASKATRARVKHRYPAHGKPRINCRSVSFEFCNRAIINDEIAAKLGPDRVFQGKHLNHWCRATQWEAYTQAQADSFRTCLEFLVRELPTLKWVTFHESVFAMQMAGGKVTRSKSGRQLGSKVDPGPAFDFVLDQINFRSLGLCVVRFDYRTLEFYVEAAH